MGDYDVREEASEIDSLSDIFAPGEYEEWETAVMELREVLKTVESVDWQRGDGVAEAEEAIEHRIPEVQAHLHDAFDTMRGERDV